MRIRLVSQPPVDQYTSAFKVVWELNSDCHGAKGIALTDS